MRITKKHDVRLNEIVDAAEMLFTSKGYETTTVNDILEKVQIGKGTFYHYFKSKEDVMDAVINRMVEGIVKCANAIADDSALTVNEKMRDAILSMNISDGVGKVVIEELHKPSNAQMHQTSITRTIQAVAPILAGIVAHGVQEGVYKTPYPLETVEFLLVANQFIFDSGIFRWSDEEMVARALAFV
ncbi:MAG: TetR/AcrR family transcriptional regulator, partial [Coriobacteriales bacterium]|nr:TetR/AcrR family transcriptional regulator [Coriobacteriales bacterium]